MYIAYCPNIYYKFLTMCDWPVSVGPSITHFHGMSAVLSLIGSLPPNANLSVYLSGGLVFSSGTLNDYFNCGGFPG
jgi:hypothetical protein